MRNILSFHNLYKTYFGHLQLTQSSLRARGEWPFPENSTSNGRLTGRSSLGTGTTLHAGQWMIGIGAPQYRCLDNSQSLKRNYVDPALICFCSFIFIF
jgi:hypothetical protein